MLMSLLLASQLWLISDRGSFWDEEKVSDQSEIVRDSLKKDGGVFANAIQGKNILLVVHGYNNTAAKALSIYRLIQVHFSAFNAKHPSHFYDLIIGYLWPGYDDSWEYFKAKSNVLVLAKRMKEHLELISLFAAKIDVLAHSMGNRLMLEALNFPSHEGKKIVHNFYAVAPAVDDESLEEKEKYFPSTQNCEQLFVFYSKHDDVLKWFYPLAEWDMALGFEGAQHPDKLPKNVKLVDESNFISGHGEYFTELPIYAFIKKQFLLHNSPRALRKKAISSD